MLANKILLKQKLLDTLHCRGLMISLWDWVNVCLIKRMSKLDDEVLMNELANGQRNIESLKTCRVKRGSEKQYIQFNSGGIEKSKP